MSVWDQVRSAFRREPAPAELPRLGTGGPVAGLYTGEKSRQTESHPLIGADVGQVDSAIKAALDGRPQRLQDLYDDMLDRDDRVAAVTATRILAIQSRPWAVKPPRGLEGNEAAQNRAQEVSDIIAAIRSGEGGGWSTCVGQLATGVTRGLSVNEIEWGVNRNARHAPKALHWRHPRRFGFDKNTQSVCRQDPGDSFPGKPLFKTWGEDKFVIHQPVAGRAAYPQRRGVMMGMVFPALFKRYGWRWWIKGTERFGQPITVLTLPAGSEGLKDEAKELLRRMKSDMTAVLTGGIEFQGVPGAGNLNPAVFKELIEQCNLAIAIAGLGQNLTTEIQGGSRAAAQVSDLVRMDYLAADLMELDGTVNGRLIEPVCRFNWPGEPIPEYVTEASVREPITLEDVKEGLFTENDYRRHRGHQAKEEGGDDYRVPASMAQVPAQIGAGLEPVETSESVESSAALNGAQIASLKDIVLAVSSGDLPRQSGIEMMLAAFPLTSEQAEKIMGEVGNGFVPSAEPAAGGADAEPPFRATPRPVPSSSPSTSPTSGPSTTTRAQALCRRLVE